MKIDEAQSDRSIVKQGSNEGPFGLSKSQYVSYLFSSAVANTILPIFYIFIPIYAIRIGATTIELGLVGGASYIVYSFMPFIMGHFSDRRGSRKFFIMASFVLLSAVSFLYFITSSPVTLIVERILEGTGWAMLWPAMEAALTEDAFRDSKKSLSVFNYSWSGGAALGPIVGTLLATAYSYRFAFFTSGLLFAVLIALNGANLLRNKSSLILESSGNKNNDDVSFGLTERVQNVSFVSSIREVILSNDRRMNYQVWTCLATTALSALTSGVFFTFFGPYARSLGLSLFLIGAITTTYGFVRFLTYIAFAKKSFRARFLEGKNRKDFAIAFGAMASLSALILTLRDPSGAFYFLSFALFALGYSIVYAISQTILIAETPRKYKGAAAGLFESSIGLGAAIGPIVAGFVSFGSLRTSFLVPSWGLLMIIGLLALLSYSKNRNQKNRQDS